MKSSQDLIPDCHSSNSVFGPIPGFLMGLAYVVPYLLLNGAINGLTLAGGKHAAEENFVDCG